MGETHPEREGDGRLKLKKNLITRDAALLISPDYVAFIEGTQDRFGLLEDKILPKFCSLKRGQKVLTCCDGQWVLCRVSSLNLNDVRAIDGPIVRVSNGEFSWRVDGGEYAYPIAD